MLEKVAFTMFSVEDPTRARAFYEDVLGLERGLASPDGDSEATPSFSIIELSL
jgi:catechol 2,3-dioxygenase-like lactoylglutathione lyase family enzyme